jgi:hypothetical protein
LGTLKWSLVMVDMTEYLSRRLRLMKSRIFYNPNAAGADKKKTTQTDLFYRSQCGSGFGISKLITRGKARFESESDLYGDALRKLCIVKASNVENYLNGVGSWVETERTNRVVIGPREEERTLGN